MAESSFLGHPEERCSGYEQCMYSHDPDGDLHPAAMLGYEQPLVTGMKCSHDVTVELIRWCSS